MRRVRLRTCPSPRSRARGLRRSSAIELDELGARGNRRFYVIDGRGRMVNAKRSASCSRWCRRLRRRPASALTFPDGTVAAGAVELGDTVHDQVLLRHAVRRGGARALGGGAVGVHSASRCGWSSRRGRRSIAAATAAVSLISPRVAAAPGRGGRRASPSTRGGSGCWSRSTASTAHVEDGWVGRRSGSATALVALQRPRRPLPDHQPRSRDAARSTSPRWTALALPRASSTPPSRCRSGSTARSSSGGRVARRRSGRADRVSRAWRWAADARTPNASRSRSPTMSRSSR